MFKTAIVGCGAIAQIHAEALSARSDVEIVSVCDVQRERAEKLRDKFAPDALVYEDYMAMLDEVKPDVLHVCTPHYLHAEMAIAALKRDIHVLLEKPVCINEKQYKDLIEAEEKSKASVCVSFQNRTLARNRRAKELIESGEAGRVLFTSGKVCWSRGESYYRNSHWRGFMATEGGGVMINQAIHTLDLMLWIMDEDPSLVAATVGNLHLQGVIDVEDTANAYLTFPGGAHGLFYATTANATDEPVSLTFQCENMTIVLRDNNLFIDGKAQNIYDNATVSNGKAYWGVGHHALFGEFYSRLAQGRRDMPVSLREAWRAVRLLLTMYESGGKTVPLKGEDK